MANDYSGEPALGYIRVSTGDQQNSIASQDNKIFDYAKWKKLTVNEENLLKEPDVSGSIPIFEREIGRKMMDILEAGEIKHLIIQKLDRLGRSAVDIQKTYKYLTQDLGVTVHIIDMGGDSMSSDSPYSRFIVGLLSLFAELEVETIRRRINEVIALNFQKGNQIVGVPFGFKTEGTGQKNKRDKEINRLVYDEKEIEWLRKILLWRNVEQRSLQSICDELNAANVPTKRKGIIFNKKRRGEKVERVEIVGKWSKGPLSKLLKNRYILKFIADEKSKIIINSIDPRERLFEEIGKTAERNRAVGKAAEAFEVGVGAQ